MEKNAITITPRDSRSLQREVSQIIFSDGIAAISVFIEPLPKRYTEKCFQQGAISFATKRHGDFWLTIIGEAPAAAIKQVANSIVYKPN